MSTSIAAAELPGRPLAGCGSPEHLFAHYAPCSGRYDEFLGADGQIRPTWRQFAVGLEGMGAAGLSQRQEQARRLLRENGLLQGASGLYPGSDRFWELDPLPLLLAKHEWDSIAAALRQRAHLLNLVLADLYGPQTLVRDRLLPPQLVFGQRSYLLPCHGVTTPANIYLHMYAGHLARGGDGRWCVFADYTQGLAGAGMALENRIVTSRVLPTEFHDLHVERLAGFFITLRDTLQSLSPGTPARGSTGSPRIVLLSPGPRSPGYFEDAYLARYLGYTLVEGGDLTVRGANVCLKTLGGLLPVDVVLRRMADQECDPLELRADSLHGVTGLVQAARSGQVAVANALGSGLLESPALMAFLPAICRSRLGEELRLCSAATWWCGRDEDWSYVEAHFDEMTIRPAMASWAQSPVDVLALDQRQREELLANVRLHRPDYVAQRRVDRSTAPVFVNGGLEAWPIGLRVFAAADRDGAYHVMPGGLARALPPAHARSPVGQPGTGREELPAGSRGKDVWVLSDRPVAAVSLLHPQVSAVELRRSTYDLPSRVADNLYWLGRHVERADGLVRHLRAIVLRMVGELEPSVLPELKTLVQMLSDDARPPKELPDDPEELVPALEKEILAAFGSDGEPPLAGRPGASGGTLDETLRALYHTASIVRDRISEDTWRIVNQLDLDLLAAPGLTRPRGGSRPSEPARLGVSLTVLNQVFNLLSSLSGLMTESMTRGPGWRFVDMGRRLERALTVLRLLRKTLVHGADESVPLLEALLEIADSTMTYRYRYMTSLQVAPLLDLLLTDETNPRSVGFQLAALAEHVRQLPGKDANPLRNRETRIMIATQAELRLVDVEALARPRDDGGGTSVKRSGGKRAAELAHESVRWTLDNFLADMTLQLWQLSDSLTQTYFTHTGPSQQLGAIVPEVLP